jgi:hypothetical protein
MVWVIFFKTSSGHPARNHLTFWVVVDGCVPSLHKKIFWCNIKLKYVVRWLCTCIHEQSSKQRFSASQWKPVHSDQFLPEWNCLDFTGKAGFYRLSTQHVESLFWRSWSRTLLSRGGIAFERLHARRPISKCPHWPQTLFTWAKFGFKN